ncbi:MAG: FkbM family methyltransferase [Accumulibacter sp.]|jgi:FkbM family methyltransferase|uniref:FkbM family methyltransferase n=1 Tax=Accumulibacter sp. TaxID=2053492 RepID=UPI002FC3AE10
MKLVPALAGLFGYDAISRRKNHLQLDRHLLHVLDKHAIDTVIDVGANAGQFSLRLRAAGFAGRIEAFEPIPAMARALAEQFAADRLFTAHSCGLAEQDGAMELNILAGSDFSSFLKTNEKSEQYFPHRTGLKEIIEVPVRRLDGIEGIAAPDNRLLLKLDTQGFDLKVFSGATALLPQIRAVLIECSVIPLYEGTPGFIESLSVFEEAGFLPSGFFPVSRDKTTLAIIEFDCMLVRGLAATQRLPA